MDTNSSDDDIIFNDNDIIFNDDDIDIDINILDSNIMKIKYPIIFLFKLFSYKYELGDYIVSIMMRLFLKHHNEIALTYHIINIFSSENDELNNFYLTKNVILNFYNIMKDRIIAIYNIKMFSSIYKNKNFWKQDIVEQINLLNSMKEKFMAIYECSRGGIPIFIKINQMINDINLNYDIVNQTMFDRLKNIVDLFGCRFLKSIGVEIYHSSDYDLFSLQEKNLYLQYLYSIVMGKLNNIIDIFNIFNLNSQMINNMFNPMEIIVKENDYDDDFDIFGMFDD